MLLASLKFEEVTLKNTKQSIFHQSFFYIHEIQWKGKFDIKEIRSSDNLTNLFTKFLSASTFKKLVHNIEMCHLKDLS
jgi:hypothetical protein